MSQHDQNIASGAGVVVRGDINSALGALFSCSSGNAEPTVKVAGQLWFDTSVGGQNVLKVRDQTNTVWITIPNSGNAFTITPPAGVSPEVTLNRPSVSTPARIWGQVGGVNRWRVSIGDSTAEGGANTGSDFSISRYTDAGALVDQALTITRSNGAVAIPNLSSSYAFAHRSGSGSFSLNPGAAFVKVNLTQLGIQAGGWSLSGNSLLVPKTGIYMVGASLAIVTPAAAGHLLVAFGINGTLSSLAAGRVYNATATAGLVYTPSCQRPVSLTQGDKIDLMGFSAQTGGSTNDGANETYVWAHWLSSP